MRAIGIDIGTTTISIIMVDKLSSFTIIIFIQKNLPDHLNFFKIMAIRTARSTAEYY